MSDTIPRATPLIPTRDELKQLLEWYQKNHDPQITKRLERQLWQIRTTRLNNEMNMIAARLPTLTGFKWAMEQRRFTHVLNQLNALLE